MNTPKQFQARYPEVDVVISSRSRRIKYAMDEQRGFFSGDIAPRVLGVTPSIKEPSSNWLPAQERGNARDGMRQLDASEPSWGTPFVAIDDRACLFQPSCPYLFSRMPAPV